MLTRLLAKHVAVVGSLFPWTSEEILRCQLLGVTFLTATDTPCPTDKIQQPDSLLCSRKLEGTTVIVIAVPCHILSFFEGLLTFHISPGPYPPDISPLKLQVWMETSTRLRFKITDPNHNRWEVPNVVKTPPPVNPPQQVMEVSSLKDLQHGRRLILGHNLNSSFILSSESVIE